MKIEIYEHVDWHAEAGLDRAIREERPYQGRVQPQHLQTVVID